MRKEDLKIDKKININKIDYNYIIEKLQDITTIREYYNWKKTIEDYIDKITFEYSINKKLDLYFYQYIAMKIDDLENYVRNNDNRDNLKKYLQDLLFIVYLKVINLY